MAHRTNGVMKLLTIVSTVLVPTSLIVALFGTSFEGLSLYHSMARFSVLAAIVVLAIIVVTDGALLFSRRRGWL